MLRKPVKKTITLEVETVFSNDLLKSKGRWNDYIVYGSDDGDRLKVKQVTVMMIQKGGQKR